MAHSLDAAVADGTITEQAAYCGLSQNDVWQLGIKHPTAKVLVRFRSAKGDGRQVMSIIEFESFTHADIDGIHFTEEDIRDVLPVLAK